MSDSLRLMRTEPHHTARPAQETQHVDVTDGPSKKMSDSLRLMLMEPAHRHEPRLVTRLQAGDNEHTMLAAVDEVLLMLHSLSRRRAVSDSRVDGDLRLEPSGVDDHEALDEEGVTVDPRDNKLLPGLVVSIALVLAFTACAVFVKYYSHRPVLEREAAAKVERPLAMSMFVCPISCEIMEDPVVTAGGEYCCSHAVLRSFSEC